MNTKIVMMHVVRLQGHPLNREFPRGGAEWDDFLASVREAGRVLVPLHVWERPAGDVVILAGHRRAEAARQCGIPQVPCLSHVMDEVEALAFLVNENLQRLDLSPVDEGRLLAAMRDEMALSEGEIARRISRGVEWVRTRQLMLGLGDEVLAAVRDAHPDRHLSLGTVEELLRVPEDWREEAVQLVLHPDFDVRPLGPDAAREVLRKTLIEPRVAERGWDEGLPKVVEMWRKRLKKALAKGEAEGLMVLGVRYSETVSEGRYGVAAEDLVPEVERTSAAPAGLTWIALALRHGLAVKVVRTTGDESAALVDARLLRLAESARAEHGEAAWLLPAGTVERTAAKERTQAALAALDGQGDTVWEEDEKTEGPPEDKGMEHHAWCDLTFVRKLGRWAMAGETNPAVDETSAPEGSPAWAVWLAKGGFWKELSDVCAWVATELRVR